jgi:acyl carrier protein
VLQPTIPNLLKQQFPDALFDPDNAELEVGAFPEWDSLAHFNLLLLIEETYGIRFSTEEMAELKSIPAIRSSLSEKGLRT